jgi:hypothetical protein
MANSTQYAKLVAKRADGTHYQNVLKPSEHSGTVRIAYAQIVFSSTVAGTHRMLEIPKNARLLWGELSHGALGAGNMSVGHTGRLDAGYNNSAGTAVSPSTTAFKAAASCSGATATPTPFFASIALGRNTITDTDDDGFVLTITNTATISGTAEVVVAYVIN